MAPLWPWEDETFIGALILQNVIVSFMLSGPIAREGFEFYFEQVNYPERRPGDVVIMDHLSTTKCRGPASSSRRQVLNSPTSHSANLTSA